MHDNGLIGQLFHFSSLFLSPLILLTSQWRLGFCCYWSILSYSLSVLLQIANLAESTEDVGTSERETAGSKGGQEGTLRAVAVPNSSKTVCWSGIFVACNMVYLLLWSGLKNFVKTGMFHWSWWSCISILRGSILCPMLVFTVSFFLYVTVPQWGAELQTSSWKYLLYGLRPPQMQCYSFYFFSVATVCHMYWGLEVCFRYWS